jgi:uncharacterized SAM-binding protein YcdF (DUF218 family)
VWFVESLPAVDHSVAPTDAIVVLTGGSERVREGLELLRQGKGNKLFVSGVNPEVGLRELLRVSGKAPASANCCIVLGHRAATTLGNAEETALWMRKEGYKSLRLVTAWYHMPRSLLDFKRAMPGITIIPHPVFPTGGGPREWWAHEGPVLLLMREYAKFLVVLGEALLWAADRGLSPEPPGHSPSPGGAPAGGGP